MLAIGRTMLRFTLFSGVLGVPVAFAVVRAASAAPTPPHNVVFILVDDLGWSDLGYSGSDFYETPNIDRLASRSVIFRNAYAAAPVCSPTRAAILTGKSPARLDMTIWHEGAVRGGPTDRPLRDAKAVPNLPREEVTLAELYRAAGYFTAHIGKWHLGTAAYYPETQGFDLNVGGTFWGAPSTFFYPFAGRWNSRDPEIRYVPGVAPGKTGDYLTDRLTDAAIDTITTLKDRRFFLSLWYYSVHSPIEAPQEIVDQFRMQKKGEWHKDPTYAGMVNRMDYNVGRVLDKLEEFDLIDETIVVFTSDNGGVDFDQRSIVPTSNHPLRSGKGTLYEGGLRVPLLIHWPGKGPGETAELCTSQDFFPTLVEQLNEHRDVDGDDTMRVPDSDGVSLSRLLDDPTIRMAPRTLYWHFPHYYPRMTPGSAVRYGDWKLIHYYEDNRHELFNLRSDPGEKVNVSELHADQTRRLRAKLDRWRTELSANRPAVSP